MNIGKPDIRLVKPDIQLIELDYNKPIQKKLCFQLYKSWTKN